MKTKYVFAYFDKLTEFYAPVDPSPGIKPEEPRKFVKMYILPNTLCKVKVVKIKVEKAEPPAE